MDLYQAISNDSNILGCRVTLRLVCLEDLTLKDTLETREEKYQTNLFINLMQVWNTPKSIIAFQSATYMAASRESSISILYQYLFLDRHTYVESIDITDITYYNMLFSPTPFRTSERLRTKVPALKNPEESKLLSPQWVQTYQTIGILFEVHMVCLWEINGNIWKSYGNHIQFITVIQGHPSSVESPIQ